MAGGPSDAAVGADSPAAVDAPIGSDPDAGGQPPSGDAVCWAQSLSDCQLCCNTMHPDAGQMFFGDALLCACQSAALCGPLSDGGESLDGGPDDGSVADPPGEEGGASALATGACTSSMCTQASAMSDACRQCVSATLQSSSGFGPCALTASTACGQDPTCAPIVNCAIKCK